MHQQIVYRKITFIASEIVFHFGTTKKVHKRRVLVLTIHYRCLSACVVVIFVPCRHCDWLSQIASNNFSGLAVDSQWRRPYLMIWSGTRDTVARLLSKMRNYMRRNDSGVTFNRLRENWVQKCIKTKWEIVAEWLNAIYSFPSPAPARPVRNEKIYQWDCTTFHRDIDPNVVSHTFEITGIGDNRCHCLQLIQSRHFGLFRLWLTHFEFSNDFNIFAYKWKCKLPMKCKRKNSSRRIELLLTTNWNGMNTILF